LNKSFSAFWFTKWI